MNENTPLSPAEEKAFQSWVIQNNLTKRMEFYDMRGYWKDVASKGLDQTEINPDDHERHFPDTYKQHGHPTFSRESKYSTGPSDGGMWIANVFTPQGLAVSHSREDVLMPQPKMAVSHKKVSVKEPGHF